MNIQPEISLVLVEAADIAPSSMLDLINLLQETIGPAGTGFDLFDAGLEGCCVG